MDMLAAGAMAVLALDTTEQGGGKRVRVIITTVGGIIVKADHMAWET
jgi:hypothetical protein